MYSVLLVDQNKHALNRTKTLLDWKSIGFQVSESTDQFSEVIPLLAEWNFSLIIINMKNYNSSAVMLVHRIRKQHKIPIILIGGSDDFQIARKALTYQVRDYLTDPVDKEALTKSLLTLKKELDFKHTIDSQFYRPQPGKNTNQSAASIIEKVKYYVSAEMNQNITLKKISRLLHFNSAYLGQKFKQHENMTFNEYLLQQRMEKAKQLLKQTDLKIYEVANKVGYTEMDWFYKKFKEYTGVSAKEYRKKMA